MAIIFQLKDECVNHLLRNYGFKITALARSTKYPLRVRKHTFKYFTIPRRYYEIGKTLGRYNWPQKIGKY